MIIWGTRGMTSVVDSGQFHCPQCTTSREFDLKQVRRYFTLYFIPLIPLDVAGRYVECTACGGTFAEDVTSYDPEQERQEVQLHMLRVMVMAALADGQVDDAERAEIQKQYKELAGLPIPVATLNQEIAMAMKSGSDLNTYVGTLAHDLSAHGKALIVELAFYTMSASGEMHPGQKTSLAQLGQTLQIPDDEYMELMRQLSEGPQP